MGTSPHYGRCACCGRRFRQRTGPGRRRDYCDARCRRRAQRQRDGQAAPAPQAPGPWGRDLAEELHALTGRLVVAEQQREALPVLLELAGLLVKETGYYVAAAVQDARSRGNGWGAVAAAAGVSTETARARWGESRVKRLLARRAREHQRSPGAATARGRPLPCATGTGRALRTGEVLSSQKLGAALSHLQRAAALPVGEAARQADLSPSYVSRILAGDRIPAWPVVHMLATIFGGDAGELRILWEAAQGIAPPARQTVEGAAARLNAALRGLHLAAARPDAGRLCAGTRLTEELVQAVLEGRHVPDWPTLSTLVTRLAAQPAAIRPLWEDVHYAFLVSHDIFPAGGLPRARPPGCGPGPADVPPETA